MERLQLPGADVPSPSAPAEDRAIITGDGRRLQHHRVAIWITFALLAALVLGTASSLIRHDREQAQQRAASELLSLTRVLEEHVARSFGEAERTLADVAGVLAPRGTGDLPDPASIQLILKHHGERLPQVSHLYVTKADGHILAESAEADIALSLQAPAPDGVHDALPPPRGDPRIGTPDRRPGGTWLTPISRPIVDGAGHTVGRVVAAISHTYFEDIYRELQLLDEDAVSIIHAERGMTLIHYPDGDRNNGKDVSASPALALDKELRTLIITAPGPESSRPRITAYRRLLDTPLVVSTSRPVDAAMADFHENRQRIILGAGLMLGLMGALAALLQRDASRRDGERQALSELTAKLEARVLQRTEELEQSNRELRNFSYSISHDLRTPLRAINGFCHALEEDYGARLDETGRSHLARVRKASVRMGELIDELLKLADVSRKPLHIEGADISQMVRDILDDLQAASPERRVQGLVEDALSADADPVLIRNALENLLGNAWKFTRESRPALIQVGGRPHGEEKLFYVTDNGVGFDMAHAGKLFNPFQRLHEQSRFEGSGIGLASVRRIIERHGGTVWVESAPGAGTTVFFTLPRSPALVRRPRERQTPPADQAQI